MKENLNNFEINAIVKEFQILIGGYIEKIFQLSKEEILIYIRINKERKRILINIGKWIYLTNNEIETPKTPTSFVMLLRKHLKGGKIKMINQHEFDRIIEFKIKEEYSLIFEFFHDGNVILAKNDIIVQPLKIQSFRHRELKAKKEYKFPPMKRNPLKMSKGDFLEIIRNSNKGIVNVLAMDINLSSVYSEEICFRTGIEKDKTTDKLNNMEIEKLYNSMIELIENFNKKLDPLVYIKDEKIYDISPIKLKTYENINFEERKNFSDAVESMVYKKEIKIPATDLGKERLNRRIKQQQEAIEKFKIDIKEGRIIGELIYSKYTFCEEILKKFNENKVIDDNIIDYNPKEGFIIINLEKDGKKFKVRLFLKMNISENAGLYFDKSKKAKNKMEGALKAMNLTEKKIELKSQKIKNFEKKKTFWYEKFRWFISSNDFLVIGGKDAKSNEMIVKKYLKENDKYIHADIHGAPSVIIRKQERDEIDEKTIQEACEFALGFSKAWNAKIGSGNVYWVDANQVSKTPVSGEYLPKGSFIIRGKRNYMKIKVQVAIGEIEIEGVKKIVGGAVEAIKSKSEKYLIIEPGDLKKNKIAKKLAKDFQVKIEDILKALPPGDIQIIEKKGI